MKTALLFCLCLSFTSILIAQSIVKDKNYFTQKSRNQKTAAFILLGGGAGLTAGGILAGSGSETSFDGAETSTILIGAGVLAMAGSIPLFLASKRNKEKAASLQASLFHYSDEILVRKIPFNISLIVRL